MMISPTASRSSAPTWSATPRAPAPGRSSSSSGSRTTTCCSSATTATGTSRAARYLDQIRYRPDPRRHGQAAEPAGGRDRRDGLRRSRATSPPSRPTTNLVVVDVPSLADVRYQLNTTKPPFDNKALRQAVAYALDIEAIVKGVWLGVGVPANGPIPPSSWAYDNIDQADQARPREGQGEAGRGRPAERLHLHARRRTTSPINVQEAEVDQGPAGRGRHHDEDQAGRLGARCWPTATARTSTDHATSGAAGPIPTATPSSSSTRRRALAQLVGHLESAGRRAARPDARVPTRPSGRSSTAS